MPPLVVPPHQYDYMVSNPIQLPPLSGNGNNYFYANANAVAPPPPHMGGTLAAPVVLQGCYMPPLLPQCNNNNGFYRDSVSLPPPGLLFNQPAPPQPMVQDNVNGGVSLDLNYDIDTMSAFIVHNVYVGFGIHSQNKDSYDLFLKGIKSVLNATRLPVSTIYYSLNYLSRYLTQNIMKNSNPGINVIYQNTIIAFILGNKFNDDKTFTNKSWSQATGMDLKLINEMERNWLSSFNYELNSTIFLYNDFIFSYDIFANERKIIGSPMISDCQTPIQSFHQNSTFPSSPCYYNYFNSPIQLNSNSKSRNNDFNYDYYHFDSQQQYYKVY
ncbi:hypothetical protein KAFR_0F04200 [Kazachstania africana CBS 2517]|uniref:Cyclin N-terminal domain-containing protein n=1 Tax=Kazachstania africana (strain ATCC 22294 / BCRC 22015 / CBS 2517 / CECT 1963 / NBRC 1671 / NRRL Y-8276) TaxID=1071382 RepID=H2AXB5_KAZAF|nr:hypothetical protein KAFR_0F04200 [Kazachstania africana CBS 2517]CCF59015.1 hypothetical protein KAFR_0F04200 [Kazachstania africana CBS 2517]